MVAAFEIVRSPKSPLSLSLSAKRCHFWLQDLILAKRGHLNNGRTYLSEKGFSQHLFAKVLNFQI